jgi:signal transduction histidine kinase
MFDFRKFLNFSLGKNFDGVANTPFVFLQRAFFASIVAFLITKIPTNQLDGFFYDVRVQLKPTQSSSQKIVLIVADRESVFKLGRLPSFADHAKLLEKLKTTQAYKLVYFSDLKSLGGSISDTNTFIQSAKDTKNLVVAVDETAIKGQHGSLNLKPPLDFLPVASAPHTKDKNTFAKDKVSRRILISYQDQTFLHQELASHYNPAVSDIKNIKGVFETLESLQILIDYNKKGFFKTLPFENVVAGDFDPNELKDKIVLIGDDFRQSFDFYVATPLDPSPEALPMIELHANMIETLIRNSSPTRTNYWLDLLITILISIFTVQIVLIAKPLKGIILVVLSCLVLCLVAYLGFYPFGIIIELSHPLLAVFLCYYFFIPYRLIVENRRSWEYYQKHKLLSEVETLKTNFVGMMSHDLKTPLARIQGMTDLIKRDHNALSTAQAEAVDTIKSSSEDLVKFINTILNYTKIESQGIELHVESRDINQLVRETIKKFDFMAKSKGINFVLELEPLFSISLDPELIRQVLANLIENAIKYSPEGSKILISTEESTNGVMIQVADQGIGIPSDEISNVFMKFFRSKNAKSSTIKGSGLGLYLAKYFVELHGGEISVESSLGAGSTFSIVLPIQKQPFI